MPLPRSLPTSLKTVRTLLYVAVAATGLQAVGVLLIPGPTPEILAALTLVALPGAAALALALRLPRGRRPLFVALLAFQAWLLLTALARIGLGEPQGFLNLVLPVAVLVFLLRPSSRAFLTS